MTREQSEEEMRCRRYEEGVPVVDLTGPEDTVVKEIADACSTFGFFQVINHGIPPADMESFREQMRLYFDLPRETKLSWKRDGCNARGYFDDELTKRRRDWKECLDVGVPGSRDWSLNDGDRRNACLDGYNRFPPGDLLPNFRRTVVEYFESCASLSDRIAILMGKGLLADAQDDDDDGRTIFDDLRQQHTSYLRMNYYPPCPPGQDASSGQQPLGISPHHDAGFLTVLIQDDDCHSLQVRNGNYDDDDDDDDGWVRVKPVPGALTINTGDMAMIWSNGKYRAPLHRVLSDPDKVRYSAPFFYNPGYSTTVTPAVSKQQRDSSGGVVVAARYEPCLWGYFRAVRFAGDLTDLGVEIQASDYETKSSSTTTDGKKPPSPHLKRQSEFATRATFDEPFSVEKYRPLLQGA